MLFEVVLSLLWAWNWPNGTVGRVSSVWWFSLGLTTDRLPSRSWFTSALACNNSIGISKSRFPALMVHLGACDLVLYRYGLDTGHWVPCNPHLLPGLDGPLQWNQCLSNIRVIGSIFNASDYKLWYHFGMIFDFGRVLLIMVLKGNILLVIVRIFDFGRVLQCWNDVSCYFTLGWCFLLFHFGRVLRSWK